MRIRLAAVAFLAALVVQPAVAGGSPTLEKVLKNGYLRCGVSEGLPGFANPDAKGAHGQEDRQSDFHLAHTHDLKSSCSQSGDRGGESPGRLACRDADRGLDRTCCQ